MSNPPYIFQQKDLLNLLNFFEELLNLKLGTKKSYPAGLELK